MGAIPGEFLSGTDGDIAEKKRLAHHAFEFEVASGFCLAAFAGIEPFALVAGGTRESFWWRLKAIHLGLRNQLGTAPVESAENLSVIADEEKSFIFVAGAF